MSDVSFNAAVNAYNRANKGEAVQSAVEMPKEENRSNGPSFSELVSGALQDSAATGYKSEAVSTRALAGEADLHELVTTVANAELTLNTVVAVRDRVVSAYQDIIKMPI